MNTQKRAPASLWAGLATFLAAAHYDAGPLRLSSKNFPVNGQTGENAEPLHPPERMYFWFRETDAERMKESPSAATSAKDSCPATPSVAGSRKDLPASDSLLSIFRDMASPLNPTKVLLHCDHAGTSSQKTPETRGRIAQWHDE